ncbi:MAG: hypothetical protein ACLR2E_12670 [Lachnospiraceae bacterium]
MLREKHQFIMVQLPENLDDSYEKATGDSRNKVKKLIDYLEKIIAPIRSISWVWSGCFALPER